MRKVVKKVEVEVERWVAFNGAEFASREDCLCYEKKKVDMAENALKTICPLMEVCGLDFGVPYATDDTKCLFFKPTSISAINILNEYFKAKYAATRELTAADIDREFIAALSYDEDFADIYNLDDLFMGFIKNLEFVRGNYTMLKFARGESNMKK